MPIIKSPLCSGCYACYSACPRNCINMVEDFEGFEYPIIDTGNCINCNHCEKSCPILNGNRAKNTASRAFACYAKSEQIRLNSSSGGIFPLLAQKIISNKGVVFGAGYNGDFSVYHKCVAHSNEVSSLRGAKYVQSKIGQTYIIAQQYLKRKIPVLFSGTPCQIAGLTSYLNYEYENLICIDLICHGVPSPKVWRKYVQEMGEKYNSPIKAIFFRCKEKGWASYSLKIDFLNDCSYSSPCNEDPMLKGFSQNLFLRPSCHRCRFKTLAKHSDITLADFWGVERILPDIHQDEGVSLVLLNSERGRQLFSTIHADIFQRETGVESAIRYNPSIKLSSPKSAKRNKFFQGLDKEQHIEQWIKDNLINLHILRALYLLEEIKTYVRKIRSARIFQVFALWSRL